MPDLIFAVEGATPVQGVATPLLGFRVRINDRAPGPAPVQAIMLRCQIRIEPARRRYSVAEQGRLLDLFGEPERWGKTVRPLLWAHAGVKVAPFVGETVVELRASCLVDFANAAAKYFEALDGGEVWLSFLFSGTVFYEAPGVGTQVEMIPWDREARDRLPVAVWKSTFAEAGSP